MRYILLWPFLIGLVGCKPAGTGTTIKRAKPPSQTSENQSPIGSEGGKEGAPDPFSAPTDGEDGQSGDVVLYLGTNSCLEILGNTHRHGARLIGSPCLADDAQVLKVTETETADVFTIESRLDTICLAAPDPARQEGTGAQMKYCNPNSPSQKWKLLAKGEKKSLQSVANPLLCLNAAPNKMAAVEACDGANALGLEIVQAARMSAQLKGSALANSAGTLCLAPDGGRFTLDETIVAMPCQKSDNQNFIFEKLSEGENAYRIVHARSQLCVGTKPFEWNQTVTFSQILVLKNCDNAMTEKWALESKGEGTQNLKPMWMANTCLTLPTMAGGDVRYGPCTAPEALVKTLTREERPEAQDTPALEACAPRINEKFADPSSYFPQLQTAFSTIKKGSAGSSTQKLYKSICTTLYGDTPQARMITRIDLISTEQEIHLGKRPSRLLLTVPTVDYFFSGSSLFYILKVTPEGFQKAWIQFAQRMTGLMINHFFDGITSGTDPIRIKNVSFYSAVQLAAIYLAGETPIPFIRIKRTNWNELDPQNLASFVAYIESKSPNFIAKINRDFAEQDRWSLDRVTKISGKSLEEWHTLYAADATCLPVGALCGQ